MFAAYKESNEQTEEPSKDEKTDWLQVTSYKSVLIPERAVQIERKSYELISDTELEGIEFPSTSKSSEEIYYVDNKRKKEYLEWDSLPNRDLPKYSRKFKSFVKLFRNKDFGSNRFKRYFKERDILKSIRKTENTEEKNEKLKSFQSYLAQNSKDVEKWLEYYRFQEKLSTLIDNNESERVEIVEKALHYNPNNQDLIQLYLKIIPNLYQSEQVFEKIEEYLGESFSFFKSSQLIKGFSVRDPKNFELLEILIDSRQYSMVHCNVTEVLKLYERAMKNLYNLNNDLLMMSEYIRISRQKTSKILKSSLITELFKKCLIFMRQSGLSEQFFAMIHLILNLNISASSDLDRIFYTTEMQNKFLVEYEELILKSQLPMNELFWRIEKLRSICNFLPVLDPKEEDVAGDPQRVVFKEDILNLLFPLRNPSLKFDLFILLLKLMKFPLDRKQSFNNEILNSDPVEIECGMEFLSVFLKPSFNVDQKFNQILFGLVRDLNISPNFLTFNIEYENYLNVVVNMIILCFSRFSDRQNVILLVLWLRLERLVIILEKIKEKVEQKEKNPEEFGKYKKLVKQRIKKILKQSKFQNNLNIYAEYGLIEAEFGETKASEAIFEMALEAKDEEIVDYYNIVLTYVDLLIHKQVKEGFREKVLEILGNLAFYPRKPSKFHLGNEELVIRAFSDQIEEIGTSRVDMETEDYFRPKTNLFYAIKSLVYYVLFKKNKKSALVELEERINGVPTDTPHGKFLRECLYELYVDLLELKFQFDDCFVVNHKKCSNVLERGVSEFPSNISLLHSIASSFNFTLPWYIVKRIFMIHPTVESVFYLILAAKFRSETVDPENSAISKNICKQRIFNTLNHVMKTKFDPELEKIQKSVLMCRLFLRATFDYDFNRSKTVLYTSLEKSPWNKALIFDGFIFVPEEFSNLLDVVFEKALRIHTLPEELSILRKGVQLEGEGGAGTSVMDDT